MEPRKARMLFLACLLLGSMVFVAFNETGSAGASTSAIPDVIPIGYLVPLTGELGAYGAGMQAGAELAEWVINTKWGGISREGVDNATIDLLIEDTATDPTTTSTAATDLITTDNCEVIIGAAGSSNTLAAAQVTNASQVVLISYASTSPAVTTQGGEYTFRVVGSDLFQGEALAGVALSLGKTKAVSLFQDNAYGLGMAEVFKDKFGAGGGTVVDEIAYVETATSFSSELNTIKTHEDAGDIDVIMDVSYASDGAVIFTEAATLGITTTWVCAEGVADEAIFEETSGVGAAMKGMWGTKPYSNQSTGEYLEFLAYFEEKNPGETPGIYADYSYDAIMLAAEAIMDAGDYNGTAIKESLHTVSQGWKGATGDKSFDEYGDVGQDYYVWVITEPEEGEYAFTYQGYWTAVGGSDFDTEIPPETWTAEEDGIPGFEVLTILAAFGVSVSLVLRRRRRQ